MEKVFAKIFHFFFVHFLAQRAARKLRSHLPLLGMDLPDLAMVVSSTTKTAGQIYLMGLGIPKLRYDIFLRSKDGYEPKTLTVVVNAKGRLELETPNGMELLAFTDPRALPVVQFLKTIQWVWPYTIYMTATWAQIEARRPVWKG